MLLLQFGIRTIVSYSAKLSWVRAVFWALAAAYVGAFIAVLARSGITEGDWISPAEAWARYLLHFPALALAGVAFPVQRREWSRLGLDLIARDAPAPRQLLA